MENSRRVAAFIVAKWIVTKDFPVDSLPDGSERAFVQDVVYTTLRRLRPLRVALGELVKTWPKGELEALLYIGAAQILYMPSVPDFAAVSETVNAAKSCSNRSIAKVVNGVLRNLIRRRAELEAKIAASSADVRESFPSELFRRWQDRFGVEGAEALMKWHNAPAETFLAYPDRFEKMPRGRKVSDIAGYATGAFIVQDPATALAVEAVAVRPGETVLDACAAPGGKTIQLAWRGAKVTAVEVNPKRRRRLAKNILRVGVDVESVPSLDDGALAGRTFDKVLVDAPCSNTGVVRRRPDARWNWSAAKLAHLVKLQGEILDRAAVFVRPGGRLVYSTCSNELEENQNQVRAFLARHPEAHLADERESVPTESGHDGAYAAAVDFDIIHETSKE